MIAADLRLDGIAELATPVGTSALAGADLGRLRLIEDAVVACRDGVIVYVGPREEADRTVTLIDGGRRLDCRRGTVLPGFVDAHTHLPFAGWRETEFDERLRGATYGDIAERGGGILSTVDRVRATPEDGLARATRRRLDELLALGTTTVEAKSGYGLSLADEVKQLRALRAAADGHAVDVVPTFLGAHTVPREYRADREGYVSLVVERMLPAVADERLAEYADAFVDSHAFGVAEARRVLRAAQELGLGVRVHADQLADDGGARLAAELGAASADHLEYAAPAGLEALAAAGTCGVLLPGATFFLKMERRPPGRALVDAGVPVVVATDFNPGTCPSESMSVALWFACLTAGLTVDEAIAASTLNAAHSLGRAGSAGSIEVGKRADLVVHDVPNRYHLVYRFGRPRVAAVVAGGRVVFDERPQSP